MENACHHHWRLESPHGTKYVFGACLKCGETRGDFLAGMDPPEWELRPRFADPMNRTVVLPRERDAVYR